MIENDYLLYLIQKGKLNSLKDIENLYFIKFDEQLLKPSLPRKHHSPREININETMSTDASINELNDKRSHPTVIGEYKKPLLKTTSIETKTSSLDLEESKKRYLCSHVKEVFRIFM